MGTIYLWGCLQPSARHTVIHAWRRTVVEDFFCWSQHLWLLREAPAPLWSVPSSLFFSSFLFSFSFFFANRHPTTAYPEERSRGGESEDTPAHTVPGVHGKDAADNMRWISSTVPNWKFILYLHWNQNARWAQLVIHLPNTSVQQEHQITSRWGKRCLHVCMKLKQLYLSFPVPLNANMSRSIL